MQPVDVMYLRRRCVARFVANKKFFKITYLYVDEEFKVNPYPTFPASNRTELTLMEIAGITEAEYYQIAAEFLEEHRLKMLMECV
jgi:hypothetical protein